MTRAIFDAVRRAWRAAAAAVDAAPVAVVAVALDNDKTAFMD